jgi:DNA phosphorothioation-associated putative methyltransferase
MRGIARERTAMYRTSVSRPITCAMHDGLISTETSVFDYGCGRGGDLSRLEELGIEVSGFDPNFRPDAPLTPADVVNLGFVVNVIEDEKERTETLTAAWGIARELLIVSARLRGEERRVAATEEHADGVVTGAGTFQKFFRQDELRAWIDATLGAQSVAVEPGIFYVFRRSASAEAYMLTRVRRAARAVRRSDAIFDAHQEILSGYMAFIEEHARLPRRGEYEGEAELRSKVGTPRQAFQIIKHVTGEERWDRLRVARSDDLLVYLALARFRRRPRMSDLPIELQYDIKDFFGTYKAACESADRALFAIAEQARLGAAIDSAPIGKRMPSALYVHHDGVAELPVLLRVLEGCCAELLGSAPDATILKFDRAQPRISYLAYPQFETDPHPVLESAFQVRLDSLRVDYRDYSEHPNPPVLHRKERFVSTHHPMRSKFRSLTAQEVRAGLFASPSAIGTKSGWDKVVRQAGYGFKGHRLVRVER